MVYSKTLKERTTPEHIALAEQVARIQDDHPKEFRSVADKAAAVYLQIYHRTEPNPHGDKGDLLQGRAACWPLFRDKYTTEQTQALRVVPLCCLVDALLTRKRILPDALPFVVLTRTLLYCGDGAGYTLPLLQSGIDQLAAELESAAGGSGLSTGGGEQFKAGAAGKIDIRWQKIKIEAETYIKDNDFPGIKPLAKILKCHRKTLRKAIDNSESLQEAKRQFDKRTPKAEPFNDRAGKGGGGDVCDTAAKIELIQKIQRLVEKQSDLGTAAMVKKADLHKFSTEQLEKMHEALKQTGLEYTDSNGNTRLSKRV